MKIYIIVKDGKGTVLGGVEYKQRRVFTDGIKATVERIVNILRSSTGLNVTSVADIAAIIESVKVLVWRFQQVVPHYIRDFNVTIDVITICGLRHILALELALEEDLASEANKPEKPTPVSTSAQAALERAQGLLAERGKTYDASGQERSMAHIVDAFNAVYWQREPMTVQQGWDFMLLLKMVRGANVLHQDSAEDMVSYAALRAECVLEQLENKAVENGKVE